jgi:hypothetical protein
VVRIHSPRPNIPSGFNFLSVFSILVDSTVAANLTYDGTEGRWKALQALEIYGCRAYLTEVYRNALAREVRRSEGGKGCG